MANTLTKRPPTIPQPIDTEALPSRRRWILVLVVAGLALATAVLVAQVVDRTTFDDSYVIAERNRMLAIRDASVSHVPVDSFDAAERNRMLAIRDASVFHVPVDSFDTAERNRFETAQEMRTPAP